MSNINDPKKVKKPRAPKVVEAEEETNVVKGKWGGSQPNAGRNTLPRAEVWQLLKEMKYDPVTEMVIQASDPDCCPKIRYNINSDLLSYIAPKCKTVLNVQMDTDPLSELFHQIASNGRPKPPLDIEPE